MKYALSLLTFVLALAAATALTATNAPYATPLAERAAEAFLDGPETEMISRDEAESFATLKLKDVRAKAGRKLKVGEKVAFLYAKSKVKRALKKDRDAQRIARPGGDEGFGLGVLLGVLLGLIGVLIAYLALRDEKPRVVKGAWLGVGIVFVLYLILIGAVLGSA